MKISILLCIIISVYTISIVNCKICEFNTNNMYLYSEVIECFHSIPLNETVKQETIETLKKSSKLYAFRDIAKSSPNPVDIPMHVDLDKELETIRERPYQYDYEFHDDLRYLYDQLRDAHTQYYAPLSYSSILGSQGIPPISYINENNEQIIAVSPYISNKLSEFYKDNFDITLKDYVGAQITSVNNIDAMDFFKDYSEHSVGISKDAGTRFNIGLTMPNPAPNNNQLDVNPLMGYWQVRTKRNPFPRLPVVTYNMVLNNQKIQLNLPWVFQTTSNFTGISDFMQGCLADPAPEGKSMKKSSSKFNKAPSPIIVDRSENSFGDLNHDIVNDYKKKLLKRHMIDDTTQNFTLIASMDSLAFWELDNNTMVMNLNDFAPRIIPFYKTVNTAFTYAIEKGLNKLIIDFTNNGGGNICLGQSFTAIVQELLGQPSDPSENKNWAASDIIITDLARHMIDNAVKYNVSNTPWSPGFYDSQQGEHLDNDDTSYFFPGVPHIRGDTLGFYSKLLHIDNCGDYAFNYSPPKLYTPSNIIVLSHGFCGSTCAMVASHLISLDNVTSVVAGGLSTRNQQQPFSFPGGQVMEADSIFQTLNSLNIPTTGNPRLSVFPNELSTNADFRYCIRELYNKNIDPVKYSQPPSEFDYAPADFHVVPNELEANYPEYLWYNVMKYF